MKAHIKTLFAATAILFASCQEEALFNNTTVPKAEFTAETESYDPSTRTALSNSNVLWKQGDQVSIFAASTINEQYQVTDASDGQTSATLQAVSPSGGFNAGTELPANIAYYPYSSTNAIAKDGTSYSLTVSLPATQTYAAGSFGNGSFPMTAVTSSTADHNLKFKNVLGGIMLQLKGTASIASISITGGGEEILCGTATVTASDTETPAINMTGNGKTVTLDCGTGVQLNAETATSFVIALPPMTMTSGFTVVVTDTDGKEMEIKTTKSQTITRSNLLKMPAVNYEGKYNSYVYVDLGLSVKWGAFNLGASNPEESGLYYQWGGIEEKPNTYLSWNNCPNHDSSYSGTSGWNKYIPTSMTSYWSGIGAPDNELKLQEGDDVVHRTIGDKWRMPTNEEFVELKENCTIKWTKNYKSTGVSGVIVTSKKTGYTDKSIFIPAAGFYNGTALNSENASGYYWSSSLYPTTPEKAYCFLIQSDWKSNSIGERYRGYTIRPVYDESLHIHSISLSKGQAPSGTATGWKDCYKCSECGKYFEDEDGYKPIGDASAFNAWKSRGGGGFLELPQVVDLGLSVKWASCNVGSENPYTVGNYYAWGETSTKSEYDWPTYKFGKSTSLTKYCSDLVCGTVDNKVILDEEDDAACVNWGDNWRMPTKEEFNELQNTNNCSWTWYSSSNTEFNGMAGYKVQSLKPGYTNNYIFIPAAGYYTGNSLTNSNLVYYWSSSSVQASRTAYVAAGGNGHVDGTLFGLWFSFDHYEGLPIRPVYTTDQTSGITGVSLDKSSMTLRVDDIAALTATVTKKSNALNDIVEWSSSNSSVARVDYQGKVTAVGVGTCQITAKTHFGGFTASCSVKVNSAPTEHDYVDLGLSVKWATCNVGANNPYDYGKYYAWGETIAYGEEDPSNDRNYERESSYIKRSYTWRTYKYGDGGSFSKYETKSTYAAPVTLDSSDDAATANWGSDWRMPTYEEEKELQDNCTRTWYDSGNTEFNGVAGVKYQSNVEGYTDKYIFLPAAGFRGDNGRTGSIYCYYWTSTLSYQYNSEAIVLVGGRDSQYQNYSYYDCRYSGLSIRPVRE